MFIIATEARAKVLTGNAQDTGKGAISNSGGTAIPSNTSDSKRTPAPMRKRYFDDNSGNYTTSVLEPSGGEADGSRVDVAVGGSTIVASIGGVPATETSIGTTRLGLTGDVGDLMVRDSILLVRTMSTCRK